MQQLDSAAPRVVLLDASRIAREALSRALQEDGISVLAAVATPEELAHAVGACLPDVAVVDAPGRESEVLRLLRGREPAVRAMIVGPEEPGRPERCFREGAAAFLYRQELGLDTLGEVIRAVARGEVRFPWGSAPPASVVQGAAAANRKLERLTPRERQVLAHVAAGHDNLKIAALLNISERTVKSHVISVYRKLDAENRVQLALLAEQLGVALPGAQLV